MAHCGMYLLANWMGKNMKSSFNNSWKKEGSKAGATTSLMFLDLSLAVNNAYYFSC